MNKNKESFYIYIILVAIILFSILTNLLWLLLDTLPPAWDQSGHSLSSLSYYNSISKIASMKDAWNLLSISFYYPPFFHISIVPFLTIFGISEDSFIFVNLFYMIILVLSIYGIGKILFNRLVGVLSAVLTLLYPLVFGLSRQCLIDFALLAIVSLVQYLILISEGGVKKKTNLLLGIVIGISLLVKSSAFIFFFATLILIYLANYRNKKDIISLCIILGIISIIALPWYLTASNNFIEANKETIKISRLYERDPQGFVESFIYYYKSLKYCLISPGLLYFFFFGILAFLIFDRRWKILSMLVSWVIPAFFILSWYPNKDGRYIVPILPAFAILTIGGICAVPLAFIKNIIYFIILFFGSIQYINLSFHPMPYFNKIMVKEEPLIHRPLAQDWKIKEILNFIYQYTGGKDIKIGFLPEHMYFNFSNFSLYTEMLKLPYKLYNIGYMDASNIEDLGNYDVLIIKTPPLCPTSAPNYKNKELFYDKVFKNNFYISNFNIIKDFNLPDKSEVLLYKRVGT